MRIERPLWEYLEEHPHCLTVGAFNLWFDREIEPINKMLSEGVEVYSNGLLENHQWGCTKDDDHDLRKAILINIQPIKKETAEDVLRDLIKSWEGGPGFPGEELSKRAKAVLDEA